MSNYIQLDQIHEASHVVFNIRWGDVRRAASHGIRDINIFRGKSRVRFIDYYATDFLNRILVSDLSQEERQWYIQMAEPKLHFYLAGCAAEAHHLGFKLDDATELLKRFCANDKSPNNDIEQAMGLSIALGRNSVSCGVLQLLDVFTTTMKDVGDYWSVIEWTADQLGNDGVIEGAQLDNLVTEIKKRLKSSKS